MKALLQLNKRSLFLWSLALNALVALASITLPLLSQHFIDAAVARQWHALLLYGGLDLGVSIILQILFYVADRLQGASEAYVWKHVVSLTRDNLAHFDPYTTKLTPSQIHQELGQNYERIQNFFNLYPVMLIIDTFRILLTLTLMLLISPLITALVVVLIPFFMFISRRYGERLSTVGKNVLAAMQELRDYLVDTCHLTIFERFNPNSVFQPFQDYLTAFTEKKAEQVKTTAYFDNFLSYASLNLMIILTTLVSGVQTYQAKITVGMMFAIQLYVSQIWSPIEYLIDIYKAYAGHREVIQNFLTFLKPKSLSMTASPIPAIQLKAYVGLNQAGQPLHQPVTYTFRPGEITVISGGNGVGKTHLLLSILGFMPHFAGEISYPNFRHNSNFSYCPAEVVASPFYAGEIRRGGSMGQLKKHLLDASLKNDRAVYLFDEPGNYLDDQHKAALRSAFTELAAKGKIVILISHEQDVLPPHCQKLHLEKTPAAPKAPQ